VTLKAKGDDVQFERALYSEYEMKRRPLPVPPGQFEDWQVAVLQNERKIQLESDPILQLMATVEDFRHPAVPEGGSLQLLKPRFVWPEVLNQADKDAKPLRLEWGNLSGYPATAYTLEARDWNKLPPQPEPKPLLRMWLLSDQEPHFVASPTRNPRQKLTDDFRAPLHVGKQTVHIESVEYERARAVELQPGKKGVVGCLVVRLRHEKGDNPNSNLVFIEPHGLKSKPRGAEHYFYNDAARYTAVFWGVTEEQLDDPAFFLGVISLDEIKQSGMPAEVKLPGPTQGGSRPEPPQ
jgi:hypothetical protein